MDSKNEPTVQIQRPADIIDGGKNKKGKKRKKSTDDEKEYDEDGNQLYEVEGIRKKKIEKGVVFYLLKWKGK